MPLNSPIELSQDKQLWNSRLIYSTINSPSSTNCKLFNTFARVPMNSSNCTHCEFIVLYANSDQMLTHPPSGFAFSSKMLHRPLPPVLNSLAEWCRLVIVPGHVRCPINLPQVEQIHKLWHLLLRVVSFSILIGKEMVSCSFSTIDLKQNLSLSLLCHFALLLPQLAKIVVRTRN